MADIFHTFFGISGLSLLGHFNPNLHGKEELENRRGKTDLANMDYAHYREIDPTYALPRDLVEEMNLPRQVLPSLTP